MAVIQYFLPGATKSDLCDESGRVRQQTFRDRGIAEALRDILQVPRDVVLTGVQHGPGGADGLLLTPARCDGDVGQCCYLPESQIWRQEIGCWIGTMADEPIVPADLQRRRVYLGYQVGEDDAQWLVPIARSRDSGRVTLPQDISFCDKLAIKTLRAQYKHLWELAGHILDWVAGEESPAGDEQWRIRAALTALNCNYRVWEAECNVGAEIGSPILSTPLVDAVCMSLADVQFAVEVKKKDSWDSGPELLRSDESTAGTGVGAGTIRAGAN